MANERPYVTIGLSRRRRLPAVKFLGSSYAPWKLPYLVGAKERWKIELAGEGEYWIARYGYRLRLPQKYLGLLLGEWHVWARQYLPAFSLRGKVVLDVGAGAGETAMLFFLRGARKVIAVEANPGLAALLRQNARANRWNLEVIEGPFRIDHLGLGIDFMKMDCDGCEAGLLQVDALPPCRIEVHSPELAAKLAQKFGLRVRGHLFASGLRSIMGN
jgi:SAM-dependent methyltransferase